MPFEAAASIIGKHLIVQPADARLGPPESYFYVQDVLIISCGVLYAFCYFFYAIRTYKDKVLAGPVEYMATTMAYELFYAFVTTTTDFEFWAFIIWFICDVLFVTVALMAAYPRQDRPIVVTRTLTGVVVGVGFLNYLCTVYPDEREQVTAFWTGVALQFPISLGSLFLLLWKRETKGHSLEIWYDSSTLASSSQAPALANGDGCRITRCLGCWTAYGLFYWRYINIPQNWSYVANPWSIWLIGLTLLAEAIYPFAYVYVWKHSDDGSTTAKNKVSIKDSKYRTLYNEKS